MPRQELVNTIDGMIGDVSEDVAQPGFRIDAVQLGRPDQRVDSCSTFAASVGAGEQVCQTARRSSDVRIPKVRHGRNPTSGEIAEFMLRRVVTASF